MSSYGQDALNAFSELEMILDQGIVVAQRMVDLEEAAREAEKAFHIARLRYDAGRKLGILTAIQFLFRR